MEQRSVMAPASSDILFGNKSISRLAISTKSAYRDAPLLTLLERVVWPLFLLGHAGRREERVLVIPEDIPLEALWRVGDVTERSHLPGRASAQRKLNIAYYLILSNSFRRRRRLSRPVAVAAFCKPGSQSPSCKSQRQWVVCGR